jgi:hypothetical protein
MWGSCCCGEVVAMDSLFLHLIKTMPIGAVAIPLFAHSGNGSGNTTKKNMNHMWHNLWEKQ